eukprot:jgi/Tetstr1/464500/TSEL_009258.t1
MADDNEFTVIWEGRLLAKSMLDFERVAGDAHSPQSSRSSRLKGQYHERLSEQVKRQRVAHAAIDALRSAANAVKYRLVEACRVDKTPSVELFNINKLLASDDYYILAHRYALHLFGGATVLQRPRADVRRRVMQFAVSPGASPLAQPAEDLEESKALRHSTLAIAVPHGAFDPGDLRAFVRADRLVRVETLRAVSWERRVGPSGSALAAPTPVAAAAAAAAVVVVRRVLGPAAAGGPSAEAVAASAPEADAAAAPDPGQSGRSAACGMHQRLCITFMNLGCLRHKAAAALTACDYRVSSFGAVSYTELSVVRVLFNAELGCRYIRVRGDVDTNVDVRHECFAYIPDPRALPGAFKAAYARAFPDPDPRTTPLDRVGSHSGRKSLTQWL